MNHNQVTFRIPVTTYKDVIMSKGMLMLLKQVLFPEPYYDFGNDREIAKPASNKVLAIKAIRCDLGIGLKEAKDLVDGMTLELLNNAINGTGEASTGTGTLGDALRGVIERQRSY